MNKYTSGNVIESSLPSFSFVFILKMKYKNLLIQKYIRFVTDEIFNFLKFFINNKQSVINKINLNIYTILSFIK